jgi:hypothetical protein
MNTVTLEDLTEKLRYAPSSILEKIWGYADALIESRDISFTLSEQQKKHLLKQNEVPLDKCVNAEDVYVQLKEKYEL